MPNKEEKILPFFITTDTALENIKAEDRQAVYIKSMTLDVNANPETGAGTGNPTGEGQNMFSLSPVRSNAPVPNVIFTAGGWYKNIGSFESTTTQELYSCTFNSLGNHRIDVLDGNTGEWQNVIVDPELNFSDDPKAFMANHRCSLRFTKDKDGNIIEKYLLITDGQSWQKYISVIASIQTSGFNAGLFPYWTLQPPHFDRRELLEWPVRPPMVKPIVSTIPNTTADNGKINQIIDQAFQVAIDYINTDGRQTKASPYSLPLIIKSSDFLNNPDDIPKNAKFILPAGSPLTEKMNIYIRSAKLDRTSLGAQTPEWGNWYLYDTPNKFTSSGSNSIAVIGNSYWLRTNQWAAFNYDPVFNTIEYIFDNSKTLQIIDQEAFKEISTGMPQLSYAMTDLGDAVLLGDNRYGYPNFGDDVINNLGVEVVEKVQQGCILPLRTIYLYAYAGRPSDLFNYTSQVGFTLGTDTTVRWGGLNAKASNGDVIFDEPDSKAFDLTFSDKQGFQVYFKGTPYSAVGEWYKVNSDNSIVKLDALYDFSDPQQVLTAGGVFAAGGYFVCRFKITVPAGRYIAALGRHNIALSGDYRNTSTYVYGIANSRVKSVDNGFAYIRPNAINTFSKEIEIDCTAGDVDVWGNGADLFYVYCPYATIQGNRKFRFIEGYFKEISTEPLPVEMFPYALDKGVDDYGQYTDKNGFYWAYTKISNADQANIQFYAKLNCSYPHPFVIPTSQAGIGWKVNADAYLSTYNVGVVGDCNRIVYIGKITDLTGTLNYSNVAISIKDGSTALTKPDGTFTLIVHNGLSTLRNSNVYVNASGNFIITIAACGQVPLFNFDENLAPCINCTVRDYPVPLILGVKIDNANQTSLKEAAKYTVGIYGADLAGRVMFVNEIKNITVPSFLERNNLNATFFRALIAGALNLNGYPDIKWLFFCVTKNLSQRRFLDWVGDLIRYIDNNGNVVTDPATAVFCSINITSLYNYNVANNFSILANYQFATGDRVRILDDGDKLLDIATYGDPIDLEVFGTNFNQAAINAGLLPPATNTVFNTTAAQTTQNQSVTLIVRYDARLDKLIKKTGFWIETYTPTKQSDIVPFMESNSFPIINGEIAEYTGGGVANPQYNYPVSIDIDFWDTYFLSRNITIPNVGNKFFSHIFQSPNITDNWGELITSGGRINVKNKNAKQLWFGADTIKSDDFVKEGLINGLATFRSENRKSFSTYPFGDITAMISARNIICIVCENDYFMVDYNYHYTYANEQGVMVTNLDNGLSTPHQKVKGKYGMSKEDTGTLLVTEEGIFWNDSRNTGFIKMDYRTAVDISQLTEEAGEKGGIQTYLNTKIAFINNWNNTHDKKDRFDIIAGVDAERGNIYLTFRPRRNNTNNLTSYVNQRRDIDLRCQETVVYSIQYHSWMMFTGFTGEGYNMLRGNSANVEFISFAAGKPYYHNNVTNTSFLNFYGIQTEPVIKGVFNDEKDMVKFYRSFCHNSNPNGWFIDLIYTNYPNSFSYLSGNQFKKKERQFYAAILRNMNSFPSNNPNDLFRSMLFDGYRNVGRYLVFRMIGNFATLNQYNQLTGIYIAQSSSGNNKK